MPSPSPRTRLAAAPLDATSALPRLSAPSASIVICNFNYARFLKQAVDSALAQTRHCQVIVVDDGSTDESRELLAAISRAEPRIDIVLQPNGGQLAAYNAGFARCRGDVVLFLDADDALQPTAVEAVLARFDAGIAKVHFSLMLIDDASRLIGGAVPQTLARGNVRTGLQRHGLLYPSAPGSGNAYRRKVLQRLFPLPVDAADRVAADFFAIYGVVAFGDVAACDAPLGFYRLHRRAAAEEALVFGNAAIGNDEATKVATRYARLCDWVAERSGGTVRYAPDFLDFSVQKSTYAQAVFAHPYAAALRHSGRPLRRLLQALWLQPAYGAAKKLGLTVWALLVLLTPRRSAFRLARHVCNPASRAP